MTELRGELKECGGRREGMEETIESRSEEEEEERNKNKEKELRGRMVAYAG
jgi:hypothetical protein